jgi:hypothetical protein
MRKVLAEGCWQRIVFCRFCCCRCCCTGRDRLYTQLAAMLIQSLTESPPAHVIILKKKFGGRRGPSGMYKRRGLVRANRAFRQRERERYPGLILRTSHNFNSKTFVIANKRTIIYNNVNMSVGLLWCLCLVARS